MKAEQEALRSGVCAWCKRHFWWTGAVSTVPNCLCGHEHTAHEFNKSLVWPKIEDPSRPFVMPHVQRKVKKVG